MRWRVWRAPRPAGRRGPRRPYGNAATQRLLDEAGVEMVGLVLEQVDSGVVGGERQILIPTALVVRGSTAPPRGCT